MGSNDIFYDNPSVAENIQSDEKYMPPAESKNLFFVNWKACDGK